MSKSFYISRLRTFKRSVIFLSPSCPSSLKIFVFSSNIVRRPVRLDRLSCITFSRMLFLCGAKSSSTAASSRSVDDYSITICTSKNCSSSFAIPATTSTTPISCYSLSSLIMGFYTFRYPDNSIISINSILAFDSSATLYSFTLLASSMIELFSLFSLFSLSEKEEFLMCFSLVAFRAGTIASFVSCRCRRSQVYSSCIWRRLFNASLIFCYAFSEDAFS